MIEGATLTLDADVDGDGSTESGEFDLSNGIRLSPGLRTSDLIGPTGAQVSNIIDYVPGTEGGQGGYRLQLEGGAPVYTVNFLGYEGNNDPWGNGTSNAQADASGEGVFRQLSVFQRYLEEGVFDSFSPAILEWGEFESNGEYSERQVTPEDPQLSFDAEEQVSNFDGELTLVATRGIEQAASFSQQQNEK